MRTSGPSLPRAPVLAPNYPNPFNPETTISFDLPAVAGMTRQQVELAVFDMLGQRVRTLWAGALAPGRHAYTWDGRDSAGAPAASGVYLYRLSSSAGDCLVRRMVLVK